MGPDIYPFNLFISIPPALKADFIVRLGKGQWRSLSNLLDYCKEQGFLPQPLIMRALSDPSDPPDYIKLPLSISFVNVATSSFIYEQTERHPTMQWSDLETEVIKVSEHRNTVNVNLEKKNDTLMGFLVIDDYWPDSVDYED